MADMMGYVILAVIPLALLVGYYVFMGRKKDEERAIMAAKWILPSINFVTTYDKLVRTKDLLRQYADELGWVMKEGKADERGVTIGIMPPEFRVSPSDFLANQMKYRGVSYSILRDIFFGGNDDEARKSQHTSMSMDVVGVKEGARPDRSNFYIRHKIGLLTIAYPLANRLKLEGQNPKRAVVIFGASASADLKSMFGKENLDAVERNIRADGQRRISEITGKMASMQDKENLEKAGKAILEIDARIEAVAAQARQGNLKMKNDLERAFDISIE
jgi:hypothetical protein